MFTLQQEKEAIRVKLKDAIFALWRRNKEDDYRIGEQLSLLQELHAKPGYGTFLQDLKELDIPNNTAYRKMARYRQIEDMWQEGYDTSYYPVRVRPYRVGKDNGGWPEWEDLGHEDDAERRAALEAAAERKERELAEMIATEKEKVAEAKKTQKGKPQRTNITVLLMPDKRVPFKEKWKSLAEDVRSQIVYEAVMECE